MNADVGRRSRVLLYRLLLLSMHTLIADLYIIYHADLKCIFLQFDFHYGLVSGLTFYSLCTQYVKVHTTLTLLTLTFPPSFWHLSSSKVDGMLEVGIGGSGS